MTTLDEHVARPSDDQLRLMRAWHARRGADDPVHGRVVAVIDELLERRAAIAAVREREGNATMVCGACGQPWIDGMSCGQKDNGWDFPTCYPAAAPPGTLAAAPDPAEAMRAKCEAIARYGSFPFDIDVWLKSTKKEMTALVALAIADAIAARKGNGEGK